MCKVLTFPPICPQVFLEQDKKSPKSQAPADIAGKGPALWPNSWLTLLLEFQPRSTRRKWVCSHFVQKDRIWKLLPSNSDTFIGSLLLLSKYFSHAFSVTGVLLGIRKRAKISSFWNEFPLGIQREKIHNKLKGWVLSIVCEMRQVLKTMSYPGRGDCEVRNIAFCYKGAEIPVEWKLGGR